MPSLFVSHAGADRQLVEEFGQRLRLAGFEALFVDIDPEQGIPAGARWEQELYAQLRRADAIVFLQTPAAAASQWCSIELGLARALRKSVFPVLLDGTRRHPLLEDVQWVDVAGEGPEAYGRLWAALRDAVSDVSHSFAWDARRSPYPGLSSFAPEDAAVFFGREFEISKLMDLFSPGAVRARGRFVAVVGPSGSGKSSLVRAGLVPRLQRLKNAWVVLPRVIPGQHPTAQLARRLAQAFATNGRNPEASEIEAHLLKGASGLVELVSDLVDLAGLDGGSVLMFIDQTEELLTRTGPIERKSFVDLVRGALEPDSPLWVVATLRSEFLTPLVSDARLAEIVDEPLTILPLARAQLPAVIGRPAQRAGIDFEPGLIEHMVEDTVGGDALPLLAYTLAQLAQLAEPGRPISAADYQAVGGVLGALRRQADGAASVLARLGQGDRVLPTLLSLVTVEAGGEPARRRVRLATLSSAEIEVIQTFVDARLLKLEGDGDDAICEVAHEALLRQWRPLRQAIERERHSLERRAEIEELAQDWEAAGRDDSYLLRGTRLPPPEDVDGIASQLGHRERDFLDASRVLAARELDGARRSNRRLRRLVVGLGALLVVAVLAVVVAIVRTREANDATRTAREQEEIALHQADLARSRQLAAQAQAFLESQPETAMLLAIEGARASPTAEALAAIQRGLTSPHHDAVLLTDHDGPVHGVAFSPDADLMASASEDGTVRLWDAETGAAVGDPLTGHDGVVHGVAFSPDGVLASAGADGTVQLWNAATGAAVGEPLTGHDGPVKDVAFSPDGRLLATAGERGTVRLWNVDSGEPVGEPLTGHEGPVEDVTFSSDGRLLASAGGEGPFATVRLWDVSTGAPVGELLPSGGVLAVALSPDGRLLASADPDWGVQLWDVNTGEAVGDRLTGHDGVVYGVTFSPDGRLLASASDDDTVRLWNVDTGEAVGDPLIGHDVAVEDVAFSTDGRLLASAGADGTLRLWNVDASEPMGEPIIDDGDINGVTFSSDGRLLISASDDGTVRLFDVDTGAAVGESLIGDAQVNGVAFTPDGQLLATAGVDGTVRLWNVESGAAVGESLTGHDGPVMDVAFSPDRRLLASAGSDGTLLLWDVDTGKPVGNPLTGHNETVLAVAFSPDGRRLASADRPGTVRLWDVDTGEPAGEPLDTNGTVLAVAISPDGRLLASAGADGTVRLWDVETGAAAGELPTSPDGPIYGWDGRLLAFSPDGRLLATAGFDGTVRLWDVQSLEPVGEPLVGHSDPVQDVAFSPDGRLLASASRDAVRLWAAPTAWVEKACDRAGRNLSLREWNEFVGADSPYLRTCPQFPPGEDAPSDAPLAGPLDLLADQ